MICDIFKKYIATIYHGGCLSSFSKTIEIILFAEMHSLKKKIRNYIQIYWKYSYKYDTLN